MYSECGGRVFILRLVGRSYDVGLIILSRKNKPGNCIYTLELRDDNNENERILIYCTKRSKGMLKSSPCTCHRRRQHGWFPTSGSNPCSRFHVLPIFLCVCLVMGSRAQSLYKMILPPVTQKEGESVIIDICTGIHKRCHIIRGTTGANSQSSGQNYSAHTLGQAANNKGQLMKKSGFQAGSRILWNFLLAKAREITDD